MYLCCDMLSMTRRLPSFFTLRAWHLFCRFLTGFFAVGFNSLSCATRFSPGREPAGHFHTGSVRPFSVTFFFRAKKESNQRKRACLRGMRWDIHVLRISHYELFQRVIALLCQTPSEPECAASCCA